jgi:hypothetical protein
MRSYALRGRDGKQVCVVAHDAAERGLSDGALELWDGRHGVYLRAATLAYPTPRSTHVELDSRSMQHGEPPKGAIRPNVANKRRPASGRVGSFRVRRVGPGGPAA